MILSDFSAFLNESVTISTHNVFSSILLILYLSSEFIPLVFIAFN